MDRKTLRQSPRPGVALLLALCGLTTAGARPAAAATASDWTASFKPALLETYVQGSGGRVMVVRVGDVSRRQPEAARALADALTQAPSVKKVIPDDVLGGPPPQDDIEVVRRATKFSLDRVFLVRVSSADRGRPPSAIASIYSGSGELVAGFTVDAGVEVRPFVPAATRSAGQGAGTETVEAVTRVMAGDDSPAVEEYLQSFVGVLDPAHGNVLYTSKYMRVLEISAFLDHVGRKDLAERQRRNETWRTGLRWGGHLVFWSGLIYWADTADGSSRQHWLGLGWVLSGIAMWTVRSFIDEEVIDAPEGRRLADEYNRSLRQQLNLTRADTDPAERQIQQSIGKTSLVDRLSVGPMLLGRGAGLAIGSPF